jgi:hypothetical protein
MQNKEIIHFVISSTMTYTAWQESNDTNIIKMMPSAICLLTVPFHMVPGGPKHSLQLSHTLWKHLENVSSGVVFNSATVYLNANAVANQ